MQTRGPGCAIVYYESNLRLVLSTFFQARGRAQSTAVCDSSLSVNGSLCVLLYQRTRSQQKGKGRGGGWLGVMNCLVGGLNGFPIGFFLFVLYNRGY